MEQQDWESINFEEMVQRIVNAKANASLRSSTIVWDLDIFCSQGHRPFNSTALKMQTQDQLPRIFLALKNPRPKKQNPSIPTRRRSRSNIRRIKKTSETRSGDSGEKKNGVTLRLLATTPLTPQKRRKKIKIVIPVKSRVITIIKKAT